MRYLHCLNDPVVYPPLSNPGTRGATSAEYFLQAGYAVIFMHRQFSLQPFSRHYSHSTNPFLDFLEIESSSNGTASPPDICVTHNKRRHLLDVLTAYKHVQAAGTLHTLTFVTVNDYLWLLRAVSHELSFLGRRAMYYLAAAVSDFFLPRQKMVSSHVVNYTTFHKNDILSILVSTQNSIRKGQSAHRDGSGA